MVVHNITPRKERWTIEHNQAGVTSPLDITSWVVGNQIAQVYTPFSESSPCFVRFSVTLRPPRHNTISLDKNVLYRLWARANRIHREVELRDGSYQTIFDGFLLDSQYEDGGDIIALNNSRKVPAEDPNFVSTDSPLTDTIDGWLTEYELPNLTTPALGSISQPVDYAGDIPITEHIHRILFGYSCSFLFADQLGQLHAKAIDFAPTTAKLDRAPRTFVDFVYQEGEAERAVGEVVVTGTSLTPVPYQDPPVQFEVFQTDLGPITITTSQTRTTRTVVERGPMGAYLGAYEDPDLPTPTQADPFSNRPFYESTIQRVARRVFDEDVFDGPSKRKESEVSITRELAGAFLKGRSRLQAQLLAERSVDTTTITHSSFLQVKSVRVSTREPRGLFPGNLDPDSLFATGLIESRIDFRDWTPYGVDRYQASRIVRRPFDPPESQRQASSSTSDQPPEVEFCPPDVEFRQDAIEERCEFNLPDGSAAFDRTRNYNLGRYLSPSPVIVQEICMKLGQLLHGRSQKRLIVWELTDDLLIDPVLPGDHIFAESEESPGFKEVLWVDAPGMVSAQGRFYGTCLGIPIAYQDIAAGTLQGLRDPRPVFLITPDPDTPDQDLFVVVPDPDNPGQTLLVRYQ